MDDLESKLGAILNNPGMMQQLMSLAQSIAPNSPDPTATPAPKEAENPLASIDTASLQKIAGLTKKSNIDRNQNNLLTALSPYLGKQRITRLERAMRAAKMANMATTLLQSNTGR